MIFAPLPTAKASGQGAAIRPLKRKANMQTPIYHVGLVAKGTTAVVQYRQDKDCLSCEILEYYGQTQTTKKAVREILRHDAHIFLKYLAGRFPRKQFARVVVD